MKLFSILLLAVSCLSSVNGQGGQHTFKCGSTVYICGTKVTKDTMCLMGPRLKTVVGSAAECTTMKNLLKSNTWYAAKCPNKALLSEYVVYNSVGKNGKKCNKNGCAKCKGAHCGGDPHFLTYDGTGYSYHGQCDLVMAHSENLNDSGFDIDIHSRTKMVGGWSYMSNAAIRIGHDIMEVTSEGEYFLNGKANVELPFSMVGHFNVTKAEKEVFPGQYRTDIVIDLEHSTEDDGVDNIRISAFKNMLSINVDAVLPGTSGMLGILEKEGMFGRDLATEIEDPNEMGQQWQVRDTEPMLFREVAAPQYPEKCFVPKVEGRRLKHSEEDIRRAKEACADSDEDMVDFCVHDLLLTGDHDYAILYHPHKY